MAVFGVSKVTGSATSGPQNICIGKQTGNALNGTAARNIFLGYQAGLGLTSATDSIFIGYAAGWGNFAAVTGSYNIGIGNYACSRMASGSENVASGDNALAWGYDCGRCFALGRQALASLNSAGNRGGNDDIAIGWRAMYSLLGGAGSYASYNTAIGGASLYSATDTAWCTAIGNSALYSAVHSLGSVGIGHSAMYKNTGNNVTGIGFQAGYNNTGNYGVYIGCQAGYTGTAITNVCIGYQAGYSNTGGNGVYLGHQAGYFETAGSILVIDNTNRTNEGDGRVKALIYGQFDAATANQYILINGYLKVREGIKDLSNVLSVDPNNQLLYFTGTGHYWTVDWTNCQLQDNTENLSIDWLGHQLFDAGGTWSADYAARQLVWSDGTTIVADWDDCILYDTDGVGSLSWSGRLLGDSSTISSVDWENRTLINAAGNTRADWSGSYLKLGYMAAAEQIVFHDASGNLTDSVDFTVDTTGRILQAYYLKVGQGYKSSDGSDGLTTTINYLKSPSGSGTLTFKNGLLTGST